MSRRRPGSAALLAGVVLAVASAAAAASGSGPGRVGSLRGDVAALDARAHHAVLDLYALDTRLSLAQARLASLQADAARLRNEQALLGQQLAAARGTLTTSRRALAAHLRALYEQGDTDTLAVVLGATSLDEAMAELDALSRVADQNRRVADVTASAAVRLDRLRSALLARRVRLRTAITSARRVTGELAAARAQRVDFIARLRGAEQLKARQIAELEAAARQVQQKASSLQAVAQPAAGSGDAGTTGGTAPAAAGRTLTVVATGYSLSGSTATGVPVSAGVVAVDPAVIPLGTRLTIPGYGDGVAADTGVSGAAIDLWFPTLAQAHAWGRRTVTITLH